MIGGENGVDLAAQQRQKSCQIKPMPDRPERSQIFLRQPKESDRRIHSPPVFRMRRPLELFLQMHETAGCLDEPFEIIGVRGFRAQPEMLEHVVRFVIALLVPAKKEAGVAGMIRNFSTHAPRWRAAQLLDQPGNSLVFVHGTLSLVSAEMTGNRAGRVFVWEGSGAPPAARAG